jgi:hypothetical protein
MKKPPPGSFRRRHETNFDSDVSYSAPVRLGRRNTAVRDRYNTRCGAPFSAPKAFRSLSGPFCAPKTKKTANQTFWRRVRQQSSWQRSISAYTTLPGQKTHANYAKRDDTNNTRPACSSGLWESSLPNYSASDPMSTPISAPSNCGSRVKPWPKTAKHFKTQSAKPPA